MNVREWRKIGWLKQKYMLQTLNNNRMPICLGIVVLCGQKKGQLCYMPIQRRTGRKEEEGRRPSGTDAAGMAKGLIEQQLWRMVAACCLPALSLKEISTRSVETSVVKTPVNFCCALAVKEYYFGAGDHKKTGGR